MSWAMLCPGQPSGHAPEAFHETLPEDGQVTPIDVLIVNWNGGSDLLRAVESVLSPQNSSRVHEVLVVDNGSSDRSVAMVSEIAGVRVLELGRNLGFAPAVNRGLELLPPQHHLLLLNPDAVLEPGALPGLADALEESPDAAVAGPRIVDEWGELQLVCARSHWTLWNLFCETFGLRHLPPKRLFGRYRLEWWSHDERATVPCVTGAACLIRAGTLGETGLDSTVPMYFEDMELCLRVRQRGQSVLYVPEVTVLHRGGAASSKAPFRVALEVMCEGDARWLALRTRKGRLTAAVGTAIIFFAYLLRLVVFAVRSRLGGDVSRRGRDRRRGRKSAAMVCWAVGPKPRHTSMPRRSRPEPRSTRTG